MKKNYLSILTLVTVFLSGCDWVGIRGNGHIVTDNRTVTEFSDVKTGGAFEIEWQPGTPSLSITTDDNLLRYIENRIEGKTLRLESREQLSPTRKIKAVITSPTLTGVSTAGAVRWTTKMGQVCQKPSPI